MRRNRWRFSKSTIALGIFGLAVGLLAGLTVLISGKPALGGGMGLVDDWSFHHLVFSDPGTAADALAQGRFEQWYRMVNDPRYIMQQMKRNPMQRALATAPDFATLAARLSAPVNDLSIFRPPRGQTPRETLKRDWQEPLGSYTTSPMAGGQYPAKYSFSYTSGTCSDYVIYPTGVTGSGTQATIIAYTNLYGTSGPSGTGCGSGSSGGAVPQVYWAYNAPVSSTDGIATLSPVIDWSGTQVAFVESVTVSSTTTAYLVLLRMANTGSTVTTATSRTAAQYYNSGSGCTAPCYTTFSLGTTDTNSPPFYDYANDRIYVGDDAGNLHQFTTVFRGTPTVGFTTSVVGSESSTHLTGPVVDPNSGLIFVSDNSGYLHSITSAGGTGNLLTSNQMDYNVGFSDAPLVDSIGTTSYVYTFAQHGTATYINQFHASSSISASYGTSLEIGSYASSTLPIYSGAFDNQHTSYGNGNLYFCALDSSGSAAYPTLYQIAMATTFSSSTATAYNTLASAAATCSPVTEFYTGSTDYIFLSVTAAGDASTVSGGTTCAGACLYNFSVPTSGSGTAGKASDGLAVTGGASGTIIDNNSSSTGESQIYFFSLTSEGCPTTSTGCAVQASQSAP